MGLQIVKQIKEIAKTNPRISGQNKEDNPDTMDPGTRETQEKGEGGEETGSGTLSPRDPERPAKETEEGAYSTGTSSDTDMAEENEDDGGKTEETTVPVGETEKSVVEQLGEAIKAQEEKLHRIKLQELELMRQRIDENRELQGLKERLLRETAGGRTEEARTLSMSFADAAARAPSQGVERTPRPVQNYSKKRAIAPSENEALDFLTGVRKERETAVVGLKIRSGPAGKVKAMLNALAAQKGRVLHIEQDRRKGTVWAVGDKEGIELVASKIAEKGGGQAGAEELENLKSLLEGSVLKEGIPTWKRDKLSALASVTELRRVLHRDRSPEIRTQQPTGGGERMEIDPQR
ncbi:MAG: uncharacterized protein A8A55_2618 [Amphiamblys sp. WSBS2006]|nr:MAG: uncharacterized protein A8A55_2618 [Amphiamblys sp. WSBS2006]